MTLILLQDKIDVLFINVYNPGYPGLSMSAIQDIQVYNPDIDSYTG
jgi:hypothetical protein